LFCLKAHQQSLSSTWYENIGKTLEKMDNRQYPSPTMNDNGSSAMSRPNNNGHSDDSRRPAPPSMNHYGIAATSSQSKDPRVPGLSNPVLSPSKPVPPPSKKQRAMPFPTSRSTATSASPMGNFGTDELTRITDEGIARRRAELRNLQSSRSTTADLLERARAVTAGGSAIHSRVPVTSHQQRNMNTNMNTPTQTNTNGFSSRGVSYPTRTRPVSIPRSPPRQFAVLTSDRYRRTPQQNANTIITTAKNDMSSNPPASATPSLGIQTLAPSTVTAHTSPPQKTYSPNQKICVQTSFAPSAEMKTIKPITTISIKQEENVAKTNGHSSFGINKDKDNVKVPEETVKKSSEAKGGENQEIKVPKKTEPVKQSPEAKNSEKQSSSTIHHAVPVPVPAQATQKPFSMDTSEKNKFQADQVEHKGELSQNGNGAVNQTHLKHASDQIKQDKKDDMNNIPPLTTETSVKRLTLRSLRDAAQPSKPPPQTATHKTTEYQNGQEVKSNGNGNSTLGVVKQNGKVVEQSSHSKIMKELLEAKKLREAALQQITQLENEVLELRLEREKNVHPKNETTYLRGRGRSSSQSRSSRRKRMKSPLPTNRTKNDVNSNPLSNYDIACRAVETVEDHYSSDLAIYVVRKPYGGNETMDYTFPPDKRGKNCKISWYQSVTEYLKHAQVKDEASIEVLAKIDSDQSVLLLHGSCCRHGTPMLGDDGNVVGYEWNEFGDIDQMDGSLGKIMYIDVNGNDGEYWLDSIYEEALKIRENYCSNVFSAALALKATSPPKQEIPNHLKNTEEKKIPMKAEDTRLEFKVPSASHQDKHTEPKPDCSENDNVVAPKDKLEGKKEMKIEAPTHVAPTPQKEQVQKQLPPEEFDSGSTDVLSTFILFFFGSIFSIFCYTICIPFKLMKLAIWASLLYALLSVAWVYFADDNGALALGAGIDFRFNVPGIN